MSIFDFGIRQLINAIQLRTTHDLPSKGEENVVPTTPSGKVSFSPSDITQKLDITGLNHYHNNWGDPDLVLPYRENFYKEKHSGKMLPFKGLPKPVPMSHRTHLCVHITAIEFGTTKGSRNKWIDRGKKNLNLVVKAMDLRSVEDINDAVLAKFGETMALHERYWQVPCHWVALVNGDILYNNDIQRYTYHGNGSNSFSIGVSMEGDLPGLEKNRKPSHTKATEKFIQTGQNMVENAIIHARSLGCPLEYITAHRCFSKDRQADPGEAVWGLIILPMAQKHGLKIDYHYKKDDGFAIPREWDPNGLVDYAGKPIK